MSDFIKNMKLFVTIEYYTYFCNQKTSMNKFVRRILKIAVGLAGFLVILLVAAFVTLSNESVQDKLRNKAVELLQEKLETHVEIDSISVNLLTQDISIFDIEVEDREQREMLKVKKVAVDLQLMHLLQRRVVIEKAEMVGAKALLLKPSKDEPANYQFVIDAFKKPKKKEKGEKMELDISALSLKDIHVKHNELDIYLKQAKYTNGWIKGQAVEADSITLVCDTSFKAGLKPYKASLGRLTASGDFAEQIFKVDAYQADYQWKSLWKKRNIMVDNQASIGHLTANADRGRYTATVKQARYKNDNHLPRKNTGRPKRGFFDAKHLDVIADFHVILDSIGKERITGELDEFKAKDSITGIDIRQIKTKFEYVKDKINLRNIVVQQKNTVLNVSSGEILLPNKKEGREFSYSTGVITGKAYLQDISRTFAPVLKTFKLPLNLSLTMRGTPHTINFRNVKVSTNDKKLQIAATGNITNLRDKYKLLIKFDVSNMLAKKGVVEQVINQFAMKKKMMMKQLDNLGDINYTGDFSVLYKKQIFTGLLKTGAGSLNFELSIDNLSKYINGKARSNKLELGKVMNMKDLGATDATVNFTFDFSKERTAKMRKQKGGKLPIGFFNANVEDCIYSGVHFRNISVTLNSDGAIATGDVYKSGRIRDLYFSYSFTNTDEMQKTKISRPGIKFHKETEEHKAQKEERKMQKKIDKQVKKAQKEEAKQLKKQQKEEAKRKKEEEKLKKKQEEEKSGKKKKKFLIF